MKVRWILKRSIAPHSEEGAVTIAGNRYTIWHWLKSLDRTHCGMPIPDREFCQATDEATSDRLCVICFPYLSTQQPAAKRKRKG